MTNEQKDKLICICCGGAVTVRDTWKDLDEETLKKTMEAYPDMQYIAQCKAYCRWAHGKTPETATMAYAYTQRWGAERIAELERRDLKLSCLEGAGVDNWEGYDIAMEMMESEQ